MRERVQHLVYRIPLFESGSGVVYKISSIQAGTRRMTRVARAHAPRVAV